MNSLHGTPENVQDTPLIKMESTPTTTEKPTDVRVRTSTTSFRYPREVATQSLTSRLRLPQPTVPLAVTLTIQSNATNPKLSENDYSVILRDLFDRMGWIYKEQYLTKSGKAIDFVVKAPHDGGHIFFGVECKKDLNEKTNITTLADYLEQAQAYSEDLDMPVFLAPIMHGDSPSSLYLGGTKVPALNALTIFGGRVNVGVLARVGSHCNLWYMVLRGSCFWKQKEGFNNKRLHMVCSTGSKKERKPLKVWK